MLLCDWGVPYESVLVRTLLSQLSASALTKSFFLVCVYNHMDSWAFTLLLYYKAITGTCLGAQWLRLSSLCRWPGFHPGQEATAAKMEDPLCRHRDLMQPDKSIHDRCFLEAIINKSYNLLLPSSFFMLKLSQSWPVEGSLSDWPLGPLAMALPCFDHFLALSCSRMI